MKTPGSFCQQVAAVIARKHPDARDGMPLANAVRGTLYSLAIGGLIGLLIGLAIGGCW